YYIAYQKVSTGVRKRILATLVYPALLVTVAILVVTYLVTVVVPKFAALYHDMNVELPTATRLLIAITVDYRGTILITIGCFILLLFCLFFCSRSEEGGRSFV